MIRDEEAACGTHFKIPKKVPVSNLWLPVIFKIVLAWIFHSKFLGERGLVGKDPKYPWEDGG
jgi:hypothetical protein